MSALCILLLMMGTNELTERGVFRTCNCNMPGSMTPSDDFFEFDLFSSEQDLAISK